MTGQREFFRLPCSLPIKFGIIGSVDEATCYNGIVTDISGGGLCIQTPIIVVQVGDKLRLMLDIFDGKRQHSLVIIGDVLRASASKLVEGEQMYMLGFTGIVSRDKEAIVGFVFNEQRKILRAEKNKSKK